MDTTGNYKLDNLIFDVIDAGANSQPPHNFTFEQALSIVLRQDELIQEGEWESRRNWERKQEEIDYCWQQRESEFGQ